MIRCNGYCLETNYFQSQTEPKETCFQISNELKIYKYSYFQPLNNLDDCRRAIVIKKENNDAIKNRIIWGDRHFS